MAENTENNEGVVLVRAFLVPFLSRGASKVNNVNNACSSSIIGGEVYVSFVASSKTHSVQNVSLAIVQLISTLTNKPSSKWIIIVKYYNIVYVLGHKYVWCPSQSSF